MTWTLVCKLLKDIRVPWVVIAVLLCLFQVLWARVSHRISVEILESFRGLGVPVDVLMNVVFEGPGQIVQTLMGGSGIRIDRAMDMLSIGYVHPLTQTIVCIWVIGRSAAAIAGEIDRGTIELLLAQPIQRGQVIAAHLFVDLISLPTFALAMWIGTGIGAYWVGFLEATGSATEVSLLRFAPALVNVVLLMFAVSGTTLAISASGRSRSRVLGIATLVVLLQFLVNVIGQLWPPLEWARPLTLFHYYQPQPMILDANWTMQSIVWIRLGVLLGVGAVGYGIAWWIFRERDLPAPL